MISCKEQGIKICRNGNLGKFFSYADNSKGFKQLVTLTLIGIAVSVRVFYAHCSAHWVERSVATQADKLGDTKQRQ